MNAQILKLVFKKYWNNQTLTTFEASALGNYISTMNEQESGYFNKLIIANF